MPNHVTTRCVVRGEAADLALFRARMLVQKPELHRSWHEDPEKRDQPTGKTYTAFDFEGVLPMPETVKKTESSSVRDFWLFALTGEYPLAAHTGKTPLDYPWAQRDGITTRKAFEGWLERTYPDGRAAAERSLKARGETGCLDWYEWARRHWGTKWNAYDTSIVAESDTAIEFTFNTAWSFPTPVFDALAKAFPSLVFECWAFEEGWMFAGEGGFCDDPSRLHALGIKEFELVDPSRALYRKVYGRSPITFGPPPITIGHSPIKITET
jgi:hypothetical protein